MKNIFNFFRKKEQRAESSGIVDCTALMLSGENVTRSQAMEIPTVSSCIDKISTAVARLPVKLYRKQNGRVFEITDDNRLTLLNGETGDTLTTVDMWHSVIEDYYLGGGGWIYINSDGIRTKSLHYVDSRNVSITTNNNPIFKAFRIFVNGTEYYDFQFLRLFRKTRTGYSNIPLQDDNPRILSAAYNALKLEVQMNQTGGNKKGFLKAKTKLSTEALNSVKNGFSSIYDNDNTGRIPILNDGIDFQPVSSTAVELQMNENKRINSQEICKLFGFPHTVIDGNATDDDNKKFTETIVSLLNQIETALDSCLLLEDEKEKGFYFAFDTKELTRGSLRERYEAYQIAVKNHILQVDEIRREEDFEPLGFNFVTMGLGDVLLNPKTMEVFTPNTGQTSKLDEQRAEIELRYNHNHDEKGRFCSGRGGGRFSSGNSAKSLDNSEKSDIISIASNAHPRDIELEKTIQKCIKQEKPVFDEKLAKFFPKIKSEKDRYIISLHGNPNEAYIYDKKIDARTLANIIKSRKDYHNEEIVLISCNTGNTEHTKICFAQKLAKEMNVTVYAPTKYGIINSLGEYYSGTLKGKREGEFKPFEPEKIEPKKKER